jgi:hypothetical protein
MMKIKTTIILYLLISLSGYSQSITPSVINVAGGSAQKGYYQFEWSVGEMALINQTQSSDSLYVLTNGFLQPYINTPGSRNNHKPFDPDELHIFPNPASKYLEIDFSTKQEGKVWFTLYNSVGQKVYDKTFPSYGLDHIERINVDRLAGGLYMLYIQLDPIVGSYLKRGAFKIIKAD